MGVYKNNNGTLTPIANETQFIAPVNEYVTKPELEAIVPSDTSADNKLVNNDDVADYFEEHKSELKGDTGNGIASIEKTATSGLVDTYTITYTDGSTSTYQVTNGEGAAKTFYVASNGSDTNDGTETNPLATVNKALELGADIIMVASGRYFQQIDLSMAHNSRISIVNMSDNNRVIFTDGNRKLSTSEQLTEGYTKVYQFPCNISFSANNKWIFQENVGALNTLIDNSERLPQQRGREYRCEDTKIIKCTSNTLNDALNEIETTGNNEFKWYIDNGILYYNRPYAVNAERPISYSSGKTLFLNNNKNVSVELVGITCKFIGINITDMIAPKLVDCQVMNFYGAGGIEYSCSLGVELIRCETAYVFSGSVGDGINAHGKTGGSKLAKTTTAIITDCWSHDNNDDGFSDHECCESVIVGGLFEHNGKAGITPSYGAHCTCNGVISRNNYNGFYYIGEVTQAEGGKYGQLLCISCLSESNTNGVGNPNAGYLVAGNGNKMDLINCKSVDNTYGYYPSSGTSMRVIDCTSADSHIRTGSGTISIINATKVE